MCKDFVSRVWLQSLYPRERLFWSKSYRSVILKTTVVQIIRPDDSILAYAIIILAQEKQPIYKILFRVYKVMITFVFSLLERLFLLLFFFTNTNYTRYTNCYNYSSSKEIIFYITITRISTTRLLALLWMGNTVVSPWSCTGTISFYYSLN